MPKTRCYREGLARVVMPALTLREGSYDERFFSSADDDGEGFSTAGTDTETGTAFLPPRRKRQCEREAEGREEALPVREHAAQLGLGPGEGEGGRGGVGSAEEAKERVSSERAFGVEWRGSELVNFCCSCMRTRRDQAERASIYRLSDIELKTDFSRFLSPNPCQIQFIFKFTPLSSPFYSFPSETTAHAL
ncbi:hypothetical protein C8R45DRAFT_937169 [Mycena sanguinolenta]|nr:hypothetical protein C8R45DRAFT_937169 [Mycena sanguinolenta]